MKKTKTILHIIDTTGPGGAETVFLDLIQHLSPEDYRSIVVIRGKGWVHDELVKRGVTPVILDAKGSFNWRYLKKLTALIRNEAVDLVQSHLLGSNIYASLAGIMTNVPVVAVFHGEVDVAAQERFLFLKFLVINYGAKAIIAVSNNLRSNLVSRTALRSNKIDVIYNGIDTSVFQIKGSKAIREQFGWHDNDIIVGSLGNIRPAKAYEVLLEAAALVRDGGHTFRFVIAGQGKGRLYESLLAKRGELLLDEHVHFLGFNENPAEFLSNLDVFLLSSSSEGFSIATIQAMASELPVIATRSGGPQEILSHRETGLLIDVNQPQQMADALAEIANNAALGRQIAEAGKQRAMDVFDIKGMTQKYQGIYRQWL